ncbi:MAG: hypothetical protein JRN28_04200 [Nitrososphaerota archaeon]|nr:hypothetical protein [Nitrososphaerota archaeon]
MALVQRAATAANLVAGLWAVAVAWGFGPAYACPSGGCPVPFLQGADPVVGILLVLDALVCFVGLRSAFVVGGVLSAVVAAATALDWSGGAGLGAWAGLVVLSLASVVLDFLAFRHRGQLGEQANPMNLPVFG